MATINLFPQTLHCKDSNSGVSGGDAAFGDGDGIGGSADDGKSPSETMKSELPEESEDQAAEKRSTGEAEEGETERMKWATTPKSNGPHLRSLLTHHSYFWVTFGPFSNASSNDYDDDSDMTDEQTNDFLCEVSELKKRQKSSMGDKKRKSIDERGRKKVIVRGVEKEEDEGDFSDGIHKLGRTLLQTV